MRALIFALALLAIPVPAQTALNPVGMEAYASPNASTDVHSWALSKLKAYNDYSRQRYPGFTLNDKGPVFAYAFRFGVDDVDQGFSVNEDGKVELRNMSMEDAVLALMANNYEEMLEREKKWDKQHAAEEEERASRPPAVLKFDTKFYPIKNVSTLPTGVAAQTNCGQQWIKSLMSDSAKRISVLHEMMHVATNCDERDHASIYRMQGPLLRMLQQNPDMVRYLTQKKEVQP